MKKWMKLILIALGTSTLAGLLMYGTTMGMYRVADTFSLSPSLKNLVPLAALVILWFIASRCLRYFQRRAKRRSIQSSGSEDSLLSKMDEERRQSWLQVKAKGKRRYVWRTGVVGWGLPVFAIFTPVTRIFGPKTHQLSKAEIV